MSRYTVGLDLGQTNDYTALAIIAASPGTDPTRPNRPCLHYGVVGLERFQLGTTYPQIVERVRTITLIPPLPGCTLVVDQTGAGRPVVDMFRVANMPCWLRAVTITGGTATTETTDGARVPKKELVSILQSLLQSGRLRISTRLALAATLHAELSAFRVKITAAANETFEAWRDSDHDDLVLAVALALWSAERAPSLTPGAIGQSARKPFASMPEAKNHTFGAPPPGVF